MRNTRNFEFSYVDQISLPNQDKLLVLLAEEVIKYKASFTTIMLVALTLYKPSIFFRQFTELQLASLFPDLSLAIGCTQNPSFHLEDVFDHTMTCLDNFYIYQSSQKIKFDKKLALQMKLALLFHDLGKPQVKSVK